MRFSDRFLLVAGFLAKSDKLSDRQGTFFVVQTEMAGWMGHDWVRETARYMVTARHVIESHNDLYIDMRRMDGTPGQPWKVNKADWIVTANQPNPSANDPGLDIAITPFHPEDETDDLYYLGLPIEFYDTDLTQQPVDLAQPVYFVGLLAWDDPKTQAWTPVPIVRSATVGAQDQAGIRWHGGDAGSSVLKS
jgi:hypothetical protein